jgi:hypothetical protein
MVVFIFGIGKMLHEELLAPSASSLVPSGGDSFSLQFTDMLPHPILLKVLFAFPSS